MALIAFGDHDFDGFAIALCPGDDTDGELGSDGHDALRAGLDYEGPVWIFGNFEKRFALLQIDTAFGLSHLNTDETVCIQGDLGSIDQGTEARPPIGVV